MILLCLLGFCLGDTAFWVQHDMKDGTAYYFHLQTFQGTWERPVGCRLNTSHLTREEIQVDRAPAREGTMDEGSPAREAPTHQGITDSLLPPQSAITKVTAAHDRQQLWKANVGLVIQLQACLRGFLVRQKFAEHLHFLRTGLPAVIKIQVAGSGSSQSSGPGLTSWFPHYPFWLSGFGMIFWPLHILVKSMDSGPQTSWVYIPALSRITSYSLSFFI